MSGKRWNVRENFDTAEQLTIDGINNKITALEAKANNNRYMVIAMSVVFLIVVIIMIIWEVLKYKRIFLI